MSATSFLRYILFILMLPFCCSIHAFAANTIAIGFIEQVPEAATPTVDSPIVKEKVVETVDIKVRAKTRKSIFTNKTVKHVVRIHSSYKEVQEGDINVEVKTDRARRIAFGNYPVRLTNFGAHRIRTKLPFSDPGIYYYDVIAKLPDYEDTVHTVFAYNPLKINPPFHRPDDFEEFWTKTKQELAEVEPRYNIELDDTFTTSAHKVYKVTMYSLGNKLISGWLSIPRPHGHYPVLVGLPGFKNVLRPLLYDDFASFQLNIRDRKPDMETLTEAEQDFIVYGINSKDEYIYRGVYMDCIRAMDFLCSHRDLGIDTTRLVLGGGSQGGALSMITAALDKRVRAIIVDNPVFGDMHSLMEISGRKGDVKWPVKKYQEYMQKSNIYDVNELLKVLDYFDTQNFAPMITCPIILGLGLFDHLAPPACVFSIYNKLSEETKKKSELYIFDKLGHEVSPRHLKVHNQWMHEIVAKPR